LIDLILKINPLLYNNQDIFFDIIGPENNSGDDDGEVFVPPLFLLMSKPVQLERPF
jgi:hypothetical protein